MIRLRRIAFPIWLILPLVMALSGFLWIDRAKTHFRALTGRAFYGLAGYHYSVSEWGFIYHSGGEKIHRWTILVPGYATVAALLLSATLATARYRRHGWPTIVAIGVVHVIATTGFVLVVAYYDINITGVFI